jgi:hypothetical protein
MNRYAKAPEAEEIGTKLIEEHHSQLRNETIRYIFRDKHTNSKGKPVLVAARKVAGLAGWLHLGYHSNDADKFTELFVIEIAKDVWDRLDEAQRVALVDHALCQLDVEIPDQGEKDRRLLVRGPDIAEFNAVVERHGLWRPALEDFVKAGNQLTIDDQPSYAEPVEDRDGTPDDKPHLAAVEN